VTGRWGDPPGRPAAVAEPRRRGPTPLRRLLVSAAVGCTVALGATPVAGAAAASEAPAFFAVGQVARVPGGAHATGALASNRRLDLGVVLAGRDPAGLKALATAIASPQSPEHGRFLGTAAFARRFGATEGAIAKVSAALRRAGLRVAPASANHLMIPVSGSVRAVEAAFRTRVEGYRLADGRAGWAAASAPELPRALAGTVSSVLGLDDLVVPHGSAVAARRGAATGRAGSAPREAPVTGGPTACAAARRDALAAGAWTDSQVAHAYGLDRLYSAGDLAAGQTIALFELEPFLASDLATFERCYLHTSDPGRVTIDAVDNYSLSGSGTGEAILDVEDLAALAPAAKIIVYDAPNTTFGALDAYNEIISQDRANIVTTSWGECESALETSAPGAEQLENILFEEAATEGQTVFAATGDTGSDDCASTPFSTTTAVAPLLSVDDPASQPFVVSVGGTSLSSTDLPRPAADAETTWNDGANGGGSGGGLSLVWSAPSWQSGVAGLLPGARRELPDVSASADEQLGITVYSAGFAGGAGNVQRRPDAGWSSIGGTSSATPIWAAIAAEVAASAPAGTSCGALPVRAGGADLGFLAPALYAIASTPSGYSGSFIDITSGNNDIFSVSGGSYQAGAGFDRATGLGAPIVTEPAGAGGLAAALCAEESGSPLAGPAAPVVTALSPPSGPTTGGTSLAVTLAAAPPAGATVTASLGGAPAAVTTIAGRGLTVVTPASPLPPGSPATDGSGAVQLVVTVSGPTGSASSLTGPASVFQYVTVGAGGGPPDVSGIGPSAGPIAGGATVTVYGSGFAAAQLRVSFGGLPARSVSVVSNDELVAVTPARDAGVACATGNGFEPTVNCQAEVVVADALGSSATAAILPPVRGRIVFNPEGVVPPTPGREVAPAATEYDFSSKPRILRITPNPGDARGVHPVTIIGRGFSFDTFQWVNFGPPGNPASEVVGISYLSATEIVVVPPTSPAGALVGGVSVQSIVGRSNVKAFSYAKVPAVSGLSTRTGAGGSRITLVGDDLSMATSVLFVSVANVRVFRSVTGAALGHRAPGELVVAVPAGLSGAVHVEPCSPTGCATPRTSVDTFSYAPLPQAGRRGG